MLDELRIHFWLKPGKGLSEAGLMKGKEGSKRFSGTLEGEVQHTRDRWGCDGEDKYGL